MSARESVSRHRHSPGVGGIVTRDVRFSVPDRLVSRAARDEAGRERAFLQEIQTHCDAVELFVTPPPRDQPGPLGFLNTEYHLRYQVQWLQECGLAVPSVHGTPLHELGAQGGWKRCLSKVRDTQSEFANDVDSDEEGGPTRTQYFDPDVVTFHPPRFDARDDPDLDTRRSVFVANLAETAMRIDENEDMETTVAIENVCARGGFEYLVVTPADVERLQAAAAEVEVKPGVESEHVPDFLHFTCDVGHARSPLELIDAMDSISSVHVHGTVDEADADRLAAIRERYALSPEDSVGTLEPDGTYQHLPPKASPLPIERVFDRLDDNGYRGPLVIELDPQYRTPEVVRETVDYLRRYR